MTELTVLKVDVPLAAQEVAVVSYARGGQWQRAEALYKQLQARGHVAGGDTTQELVNALAAAGKGVEAAALLAAAAAQAGVDAAALAPAHCVVARALARQGQVEEAYAMLNRMMRAEMRIDSGTFTSVAASCMDHGSTELAEEVLEMRDYL
ncbi:hypothetical protein HYH02_005838 [Chlamydomonas schloesseri]|uniref:Pentacotripeptide-repeat region of PRORP domain-containing protein n=1 Tax=Chlamydomonas schloesseri TaxID=2026947 RepID=A0A835WKT3_9CHLO|nr:hypothetical protein HYH02_005838 [Chlamydomonas schloesseri]|eukprot:KAG2449089.1 hypothetical protein HYH02_005838 [Chlamydomonas schloesseri]